MPRPIKPAIPNDCRYQETLIANTLRKWSAANQHGLQNPARSYKFDSLVPSEPDTLVKVSQRWAKRHRMRSEEQFMKLMNRMCYVYKYIYIYILYASEVQVPHWRCKQNSGNLTASVPTQGQLIWSFFANDTGSKPNEPVKARACSSGTSSVSWFRRNFSKPRQI